jgi:hypothetical protein
MPFRVDWGADPPPPPVARVWVATTDPCKFALLGPLVKLYIHWIGRRSFPCEGEDRCPRTLHAKPCRWQAYAPAAQLVPVQDPNTLSYGPSWKRAVLPVSELMNAKLEAAGVKIPGTVVTVARSKTSKEVVLREVTTLETTKGLPEWFDVKPILYRLWGIRPPREESEEER